MTAYGVDYSFSRPTPSQLKAAGKTFASRYFGTTWSGKNATQAEVEALEAAGITLVTNYEGGKAGWMSGGYNTGVAAAKAVLEDPAASNMPADRPVYFSADYNATYDQYKAEIKPCLQGAAAVLGTKRVGIYGGLEQVDWAHEDGVAPWVWQTYAWSYGQLSRFAKFYQYHNGVTLGSGIVDLDRSVNGATDFGQWDTGDIMLDATDKQWILDNLRGSRGVTLSDVVGKVETTYNQINAKAGSLHNEHVDLSSKLDSVLTALSPTELAQAVETALANQGISVAVDGTQLASDVVTALKSLTLKVA